MKLSTFFKKFFTLFLLLPIIFEYNLQTALALPPGTPSKFTAQAELDSLEVEVEEPTTGYSRDKFPHWIEQGDGCDTRQIVLMRDADEYIGECPVTSGRWYSYYEGAIKESPSEIDIDHIVPLAEAWRSGASSWSTERREQFANDLNGPALIAVSSSSNRSKGDKDPSMWRPARPDAYCAYAKWWIHTKSRWKLSLQESEKAALQSMLNTCQY